MIIAIAALLDSFLADFAGESNRDKAGDCFKFSLLKKGALLFSRECRNARMHKVGLHFLSIIPLKLTSMVVYGANPTRNCNNDPTLN
jgi:hypothetical protein